jgi:Xaa-Pro aminopeptidase
VGRTEQQIARDLEWRMFALGAEALAFETIVAAGPNSAIPHHEPTSREVGAGDLLKIDFGARYAGYHADCTRTMMIHDQPADWQREIYDLVASSQEAGRHALAPGVARVDVDDAARSVISAAGYGDHFVHGLGHGVGLEIHEEPYFSPRSTGKLLSRTPVTVEPGVYLPDRGGVRIEDTLVVADTPELLTTTTRELLVVG